MRSFILQFYQEQSRYMLCVRLQISLCHSTGTVIIVLATLGCLQLSVFLVGGVPELEGQHDVKGLRLSINVRENQRIVVPMRAPFLRGSLMHTWIEQLRRPRFTCRISQ